MRTQYCGQLSSQNIGETVTLCGWIDRRRDLGGVIFLHLRDRSGSVQIVSDPERTPDSYHLAEGLRSEYVVQIEGRVCQRPEESFNDRIATGDIEVYADRIEILNSICAENG
jgi:aspartyl-tRNA synthetase